MNSRRRTAGHCQTVELKGQEEGVVRTLQTAKVKSTQRCINSRTYLPDSLCFTKSSAATFSTQRQCCFSKARVLLSKRLIHARSSFESLASPIFLSVSRNS